MLCDLLRPEGVVAGRKRIGRLMVKMMGIKALYRKANTSRRAPGHHIYPYLLRNLVIDRPNHVWAADIIYIPIRRGFVYLVAVVDCFSRKVLAWRMSNTLTADFCADVIEEAILRYGRPKVFNTNQGSQFTSVEFTTMLKEHEIGINMDDKGCWRDNVFIERLWRSVKFEEGYLHAYDSVPQAKERLASHFAFYNDRRPHRAFDGAMPYQTYFDNLPPLRTAA